MSLSVRAEFFNVFNGTYLNNPASTNAGATQSINGAGQTISGFEYIRTGTTFGPPRIGLSAQCEKFLIAQSRKFLFEPMRIGEQTGADDIERKGTGPTESSA